MVNINNFFKASIGTFAELYGKIPNGFEPFFKSDSGSIYLTNEKEDTLIRISDHWGSGINECNWYLEKFNRCNSYNFTKQYNNHVFFGIIKFSDLTDIQNL